jgi:molybdopterin/thiamine biosynthesis adenylyltransferase
MRSRQDKTDVVVHGQSLMHERAMQKIGIVGCGMGGGKALLYMSALGYKEFIIYDFDVVKNSDIAKAPDVFSRRHLGLKKAEAVKQVVEDKFDDVKVLAEPISFEQYLIESKNREFSALMDFTDNMGSKAVVVRYCREKRIPYTGGGIIAYKANIVVSPSTPDSACLFCIEDYEKAYYEEREEENEPDCQKTDGEEGFMPTSNLTASTGVAFTCIELDKLLMLGQAHTTHTVILLYPTPKYVKTGVVKKNPECILCNPP